MVWPVRQAMAMWLIFKTVSDNETEQTRTDMSASYDTFLAPAVAFLTPELQKDGMMGAL